MRFLVDVSTAEDGIWRVLVRPEGEPVIAQRFMRRLAKADGPAVPLPPEEEANTLPRTAAHRVLCTATDPGVVLEWLARLSARQGGEDGAAALGRYLFACLLGNETWAAIVARPAPGEPIELSLGWGTEERELYRLPWELMHGPGNFLGTHSERRIAITRRVAVPGAAAAGVAVNIEVRPRVLFVVGASLDDSAIQAGAEWVGLLRRLHAGGVALISHALVEATPLQVRDAVENFRPSILHFICHGSIDASGAGRIYLMSEELDGKEESRTASQIVDLLGVGEGRPQVVVLNACSTGGGGTAPEAPLGTPLAAQLAAAGVPIVVAHTGRVADRACRLFTRRFYEALLQGENLADATAEGRRTARALGGDPGRGIDWAFPALFLAEGVGGTVKLIEANEVGATARRAAAYRTLSNPPGFCGRIECMSAFDALLHDRSMQPKRVLAYEVVEREPEVNSPRYGKTRLLEELAARAVHEGVEPCLVTFPPGSAKPKNAGELGIAVLRAIMVTRLRLGLAEMPAADFQSLKAKKRFAGDGGVVLAADVQNEIELQDAPGRLDGRVVGAALRCDLRALAGELSPPTPAAPIVSPLVVLIDEVDEFGDAARELLYEMLTRDGLGSADRPIPVVLAYSGSRVAGERATAAQALTSFFESGRSYVGRVELRAFRGPVEDRLAYRQFLLNLDTPLVVAELNGRANFLDQFFEALHTEVRGVPSRLEKGSANREVFAVIDTSVRYRVLEPARDQEALEEVRREGV